MASPSAASALQVTINDVVFNGTNLTISDRYRLKIRTLSPGSTQRVLSDYVTYTSGTLDWRTPLGINSPVIARSSPGSIKISLRRCRRLWFDETVARCEMSCTPRSGRETLHMVYTNRPDSTSDLTLTVSVSDADSQNLVKAVPQPMLNPTPSVNASGPLLEPSLVVIAPDQTEEDRVRNTPQSVPAPIAPTQIHTAPPNATLTVSIPVAGADETSQAMTTPISLSLRVVGQLPAVDSGAGDDVPLLSASLGLVSNRMSSLLEVTEQIVGIGNAVAELHPLVKVAWGVISFAATVALKQAKRDVQVERLAHIMAQACLFVEDIKMPENQWKGMGQTIRQILQQVTQCGYFIKSYCVGSFGQRALKSILSGADRDKQITNYEKNFELLQQSLLTRTASQCHVMVGCVIESVDRIEQRVSDIVDQQILNEINYARLPNSVLQKGCLPGTRVELVDIIVHWAAQAQRPPPEMAKWDPSEWEGVQPDPSAKVLWVCGLSGSGKSTILHSVARRLRALGCLGASFAFSESNQTIANPGNLFGTLARSLAVHDPLRKRHLVDAIKDDPDIRNTTDCLLQFNNFIVTPSSNSSPVGDTIIVIDAFDESGSTEDRSDLLSILTTNAQQIPAGLRFIITSRFEEDVQARLSPRPDSVDIIDIDKTPRSAITRDIKAYVQNYFKDVPALQNEATLLTRLADKAELSFQWASLTCHFVKHTSDGNGISGPKLRLTQVLDGKDNSVDHIYRVILDRNFSQSSSESLQPLVAILGFVISAQGDLSLRALVALASRAGLKLSDQNIEDYLRTLKLLASLLDGTTKSTYPIRVVHTSFAEFLQNKDRSGESYYVDTGKYASLLALGCLGVLQYGLQFDICKLRTSSKPNKDIKGLSGSITRFIPPALQYACKFWPHQVAKVRRTRAYAQPEIQQAVRELLENQVLEWLEATSLLKCVYSALDALLQLINSEVLQNDLRTLALDVTSFITMFAVPMTVNAAHVYLSAFAFAPECSRMRTARFCGEFVQTVVLKQGRLHEWPKSVLTLQGHTDRVLTVDFSPDGQKIISGSTDETVRVWDARTGVELIKPPLRGHGDAILSVAFSPDGLLIASAGEGPSGIHLWDATTGHLLAVLPDHEDSISSISFSPDGRMLASGGDDETVRVWDVENRAASGQPLRGHTDEVWVVTFCPSSAQILASGSRDGTIRVWDINTGSTVRGPWNAAIGAVNGLSFSPDGKQLVCCGRSGTVLILDAESGMQLGKPLESGDKTPSAVLFSPDGSQIIAAFWTDNIVYVWDANRVTDIPELLEGHTGAVRGIAVSHNSLQIATGSHDKTIRIWNAKTGGAVDRDKSGMPEGHTFSVRSVAVSPDGSRIVSGSNDNTVRIWESDTGAAIGTPLQDHAYAVLSVAYSPDGRFIASGSADCTVCIWDAETADLVSGPLKGHDSTVWCVAFSPDSTRVLSCSEDATVRLWSTETGKAIGEEWCAHSKPINTIVFSADGALLATGSDDNSIRVWDAKTLVAIGEPLEGHQNLIMAIAFSPDNTKIASGSMDKELRLWDVDSRAAKQFIGHDGSVWSLAFFPDGRHIASCSDDMTIRLWDVETCLSVMTLRGHTREITSLAFFPDGSQLVSGSFDKTIRVWDMKRLNVEVAKQPKGGIDNDGTELVEASSLSGASGPDKFDQYPPSLFPNSTFTFEDGWIVGPNHGKPDPELILWVHPSYREGLWEPGSRVISTAHITELDFSALKYGTSWVQCRKVPVEAETSTPIES